MARFLAFAAALLLAPLAGAQEVPRQALSADAPPQTHYLEIRDGRLWIDGEAMPEEALPAELRTDDAAFNIAYRFVGSLAPTLALNGRTYRLHDGRLERIDMERPDGPAFGFTPTEGPRTPDPEALREASEAAYLRELSEHDRALYERLMEERRMEGETVALAYALRQAKTPDERSRLRGELAQRLDAIFELRQENRREEIRQVETLLETLRERLRERESMREAIIEHRLRELGAQ